MNVHDGTRWAGESPISTAPATAFVRVASDGPGYAIARRRFNDATGLYDEVCANLHDGSGWTDDLLLRADASPSAAPFGPSLEIASDGGGYAVVWRQDDGAFDSLYAKTYGRAAWGEVVTLEAGDGHVGEAAVIGRGAGYSAAWTQDDPADPTRKTMWRTSFLVVAAAMLGLSGCGGGGGGGGPSGPPADVQGIWEITETMGGNTCDETVGAQEVYDVSVEQEPGASTFEVTVLDTLGNAVDGPFIGSISGNTISWTGSFDEDGGTTTAEITGTVNGVESCSGSTTFTGARQVGG